MNLDQAILPQSVIEADKGESGVVEVGVEAVGMGAKQRLWTGGISTAVPESLPVFIALHSLAYL